MAHGIGEPEARVSPYELEHRFRRLKEMGCICCWAIGVPNVWPEIHHLNGGGHAGQKRRGDEFTIPLCSWHHQSQPHPHIRPSRMRELFGPSLKSSRLFRQKFGTDDELLAKVNDLIQQMDALAKGVSA